MSLISEGGGRIFFQLARWKNGRAPTRSFRCVRRESRNFEAHPKNRGSSLVNSSTWKRKNPCSRKRFHRGARKCRASQSVRARVSRHAEETLSKTVTPLFFDWVVKISGGFFFYRLGERIVTRVIAGRDFFSCDRDLVNNSVEGAVNVMRFFAWHRDRLVSVTPCCFIKFGIMWMWFFII